MGKQKDLFLKIWKTRERVCVLCGQHLGIEPRAHYFSHVLSKGAYPHYKLNPDNIVLKCIPCHTLWETGSTEKKKGHRELIKLKEKLKRKYYEDTNKLSSGKKDKLF
jgi:hypothetical protein